MINAHYNAVKAMFPPELKVYLGGAPVNDVEYPYAVLWGGELDEVAESLEDVPDIFQGWVKLTVAGLGFDSAAGTMQKCRDALNDKAPEVPGRKAEDLRLSSLVGIRADTAVVDSGTGLNPYYGVDEFHLVSQAI